MPVVNDSNVNFPTSTLSKYSFIIVAAYSPAESFFILHLIYLPLLILPSLGFSASSGIAQYDPIFIAPGIRPALQRSLIHLAERFHFFAVCLIDK